MKDSIASKPQNVSISDAKRWGNFGDGFRRGFALAEIWGPVVWAVTIGIGAIVALVASLMKVRSGDMQGATYLLGCAIYLRILFDVNTRGER